MAEVMRAGEKLAPPERVLVDRFLTDITAIMTEHPFSLPESGHSLRLRSSAPRRPR